MHAADEDCGPDERTKRLEKAVFRHNADSSARLLTIGRRCAGYRGDPQVIGLLLQFRHQWRQETCSFSDPVLRSGSFVMRMIAFLAVLSVALLPLGGCFFHHNQAVEAQPLPPLK